METATAPNPRASLLAGLRTGGVRSTSASIPHTAAPGGSFNIQRFASQHHPSPFPEDEEDQLVDLPQHSAPANHYTGIRAPMTAAVDGPNNRFSQQMGQRGMNPNSTPFTPALQQSNQLQNQALQMQMLQMEIMRIQNLHAQQMQAEMIVHQVQQQQQQAHMQSLNRRSSQAFNPPATAGPLTNSFDLRTSALLRRANQNEQMRSQLGVTSDEQVPMTAALGGKFGSRTMSLNATGTRYSPEDYDDSPPPPTPGSTTVISGGTSLGSPASNNIGNNISALPSKSDSVTSWRRGGNNNSVLSGNNRAVSSPSVKITPPQNEQRRVSPPPVLNMSGKIRPMPLRFSGVASQPLPAVTIDTSSDSNDNDDGSSSSSAASNSSPTTPRSSSSNETSLSPREEASKKLYEGLGIGRPASTVSDQYQQHVQSVVSHRVASQPMRQPRGPPSGADELGPKNFASRIRRQAIGGLGMLMGARERREFVEVF
ncbi:hypothetical protein BDZ94DRAFT_558250 [Collybia nuda]|uniref:Uncharacterized protein n=1 Tax=Collybia nuda TaxID=64659 RepID=A0A9P5YFE3_9AGAR|nr:hypothetical protein BDZ94DRAFT_558250 [Collybia nuda]